MARPLRSTYAALALLATAFPAAAQIQGSTPAMTCGQAAGLVRARGAIVLGTGGQRFDRFVADRRFCEVTEQVRPAFVPTRDNPQCPIGYTCFEPSRGIFDDF